MRIFKNIEDAADALRMQEPTFLKKAAHGYICPECNQGAHKGNGVTRHTQNKELWYCVSCKKARSIFGLYASFTGIPDDPAHYPEIVAGVARYFGADIEKQDPELKTGAKKEPRKEKPVEPRADHTAEYQAWNKALKENPGALQTVKSWGITDAAIDHFMIGYAANWSHEKSPEYRTNRVIFPRSKYTYSARLIDRSFAGRWKYMVTGAQNTLFNSEALAQTDSRIPIVVVEGEIDAIIIWGTGHLEVIALGSVTNAETFIKAAKKINPAAVYILALDNDTEGKKTQDYIADALHTANIAYISADTAELYDGMKDAGEAGVKDLRGFTSRLFPYYDEGYGIRITRDQQAEQEAYSRSGAGMVDSFLQVVEKNTFEPISSGLSSLDNAIGGGFIRQSVIMLGAAPGMGKTALISQICENIARTGEEDILYLNLEMSREILIARSLARIANTAAAGKKKIGVNEILRGYAWDDDTRDRIHEAAEIYKDTIAQHLVYNPGEPVTDLAGILQKIEDEKRRLGHAPIVVIDYLQLITGEDTEDAITVIKRSMLALKKYANDNNTLVFAITANNRASMTTGQSGLNSGRDSSNIEYGADVHLGLEYEAVGATVSIENGTPKKTQGKDLEYIGAVRRAYHEAKQRNTGIPENQWIADDTAILQEYRQICTRYIVRVNKNRYGDADRIARLTFDGERAQFMEIDSKYY